MNGKQLIERDCGGGKVKHQQHDRLTGPPLEQAFRNMKSVSLEMRPIHHKTDSRIRAHVFLWMLPYFLQWHLKARCAPLFGEQAEALAGKTIQAKNRA